MKNQSWQKLREPGVPKEHLTLALGKLIVGHMWIHDTVIHAKNNH